MRVELIPVGRESAHVRILFTGDTDERQWLARPRAFLGGRPDGNYFEFNPPARYLGIQVKRHPYQEHELLPLDNQATVDSDDIDLARLYDLPGDARVSVRYSASHPLVGAGGDGGPFEQIESDWVVLVPAGQPAEASN